MRSPRFGGSWTEKKLSVVRRYLEVYAGALKSQPFKRLYIDAFAGTGARAEREASSLPLLDLPDIEAIAKGSARLALEVEPPFHEYILIEKITRRAEELSRLRTEYPTRAIRIVNADANDAVGAICQSTNWRSSRGVIFLDPFGLQLSWATLVQIAETRALDMWILIPTGIGLRRMLTKDGDIPKEWQETLDRFLGTREWRTEFYSTEESVDLLGEPIRRNVRDARSEKLEDFVLGRLRTIFPTVLNRGVAMTNTRGHAMYLLCFASANPSSKVKTLALRLAQWAARA